MTKTEAADIFGSFTKMAEAIGVTKSAISQWPDDLDQSQIDRVVGAAIRLGLPVPPAARPDEAPPLPKARRKRA